MTERDGVGGDNHETEFETDALGTDETPADSADSADPVHRAQSSAFAGDDAGMVDLSAIQADDALLDALGAGDSRVDDELGNQELSALLLAWRRDVDSEAIPELVDTQSAVTTVKTAVAARNGRGRGRRRMLVPVAAAAAVLAIGFTGTALAARSAEPGDTLWGLSKVLYSDHARSVEAAASVRTDLDAAHLAIAQERYGDARRALEEAEAALSEVTGEDELARLRARHMELMAQLEEPGQSEPEHTSPASSSSSSSSSGSRTSTTPGKPHESSQDDVPPELDETSSIPTTEPSTSPTDSTTPSTPPEESPTEDGSDSRSDTSRTEETSGLIG